uniref:Putative secreted protein n=1 Tax=Anopheles darlingi TaxID=43151 RepID=A0A2M4DB47_ANODA
MAAFGALEIPQIVLALQRTASAGRGTGTVTTLRTTVTLATGRILPFLSLATGHSGATVDDDHFTHRWLIIVLPGTDTPASDRNYRWFQHTLLLLLLPLCIALLQGGHR